MAGELSKILDHIEKIGELDLDGVAPTSHVVDVAECAAPRRAAAVPAARGGARAGAGRGRRRLPRAQPAPHERRRGDPRPDRRAGGGAPCERGELDRRELLRGLPRARRGRRAQRLHVGRRRGARADRRARPLHGVPLAVKDLFCTEGMPEPGGLAHPRGLPPALHGDRRAPAGRGGRAAAGQDQPGRVRDGLVDRELGLRAGAEPMGSHARARRLVGRQRRRGGGRAARPGRSAPTPAARSASPPRCAASSGSSRPTARSAATA